MSSQSQTREIPVAFRGLSKADAAYLELRARILDGRLPPSVALNQEQLATEFGVSTTPLREALRRLESEGYVQMPAHRDVIVAPLDEREFSELYDVRARLDALSAQLAARAHDDRDRLSIEAALADMRTSRGDSVAVNRRFHRAIYVASHNEVLVSSLDSLWDRSDRYRRFSATFASSNQTIAEHKDLARLVLARDEDGAAERMLRHVLQAKNLLEEELHAALSGREEETSG